MNDTAKNTLPWGPEKKLNWFLAQSTKRSYRDDVLTRLETLRKAANPLVSVEEYGRLTFKPESYPLFAVRVGDNSKTKPLVLITGGVHGYETSGVKGALAFLEYQASAYASFFNFVVAPCISPWSYETINRLNPIMENPNREFKAESKSEESRLLMNYLNTLNIRVDAHIDLHETTDSDRSFIPEEYAKNGLFIDAKDVDIPDGFYLIGTEGQQRAALETAMIESVREVTHIAKPDDKNQILGSALTQEGVIHHKIPGLCAEFTPARDRLGAYTTEMYPDSPSFKGLSVEQVESICNNAQIACILGALNFWRTRAL